MVTPENMEVLSQTDISTWAMNSSMTGLSDVRDQKEVILLSTMLVELGHRRYGQMADVLAQRIREIKMAKAPSSSWEKAAPMSLLPQAVPNTVAMPDNGFVV